MQSFYAPAAVAIVFNMIGQIPPMSEHHLLYQTQWLRRHAKLSVVLIAIQSDARESSCTFPHE